MHSDFSFKEKLNQIVVAFNVLKHYTCLGTH